MRDPGLRGAIAQGLVGRTELVVDACSHRADDQLRWLLGDEIPKVISEDLGIAGRCERLPWPAHLLAHGFDERRVEQAPERGQRGPQSPCSDT
jgi:hypothetical protein